MKPDDEEEEEKEPSPPPEEENPWGGLRNPCMGEICFWYVPMANSLESYANGKFRDDWGIHMDVKCFHDSWRPEGSWPAFFCYFLHEYLHHIVDSWAFEAGIEPEKRVKLHKSIEQEERKPLRLEETLANANYLRHLDEDCHPRKARDWHKECVKYRGPYELWHYLTDDESGQVNEEMWVGVSNHVALQTTEGELLVGDTKPKKGWDEDSIMELRQVVHSHLKGNEFFNPDSGFAMKGKSSLVDIPLIFKNHCAPHSDKYLGWKDWVRSTERKRRIWR